MAIGWFLSRMLHEWKYGIQYMYYHKNQRETMIPSYIFITLLIKMKLQSFFTLMDAASVNLLNTYVLQLHKPRKRSVKATVYVAQSKMISHQPEWGIPVL